MDKKTTVIHWFRKGLRIHDNPALTKACEAVNEKPESRVLRPIFVLDPGILKWMNVGSNRFRFLQQSLMQLHEQLQGINSRLFVVRGNPSEVFPHLFSDWNVSLLTFESDIEPYAKKRDALVESQCKVAGVTVIQELSHTIFDPYAVLQRNGGKPVMQYQKFLAISDKLPVPEPLGDPPKISPLSSPSSDKLEKANPFCYDPPLLEELVPEPSTLGPSKYPGGEKEALRRMDTYIKKTEWICKFEKPNTAPNSIEPSTTVLSPYLKFGCLSSRLFFKKLREILRLQPKHSKPPVSLVGQLMWREFYYAAGAGEPNYDRMLGNSICYQIPWNKNEEHLEAWAFGRTGYPFIDAIMRQLRQEGWIHHLARHAVACFLTRGDLWISWEEGQKVFEELLLDADWALNAGNWMWLSASAFFYQYFRVYSPVAFGKKTDPQGNYIRKYVPELKNYPAGVIYEPWKASLVAQKEYKCVLGKDYPHRIVIHEVVSKENLAKMNAAYKANKEAKNGIEECTKKTPNNKRKANSPSASTSKKTPTPSKNSSSIKKYFKKNGGYKIMICI